MGAHTPRRWMLANHGFDGRLCVIDPSDGDFVVCDFPGRLGLVIPLDARLIVAAPELLETLQYLIEKCEDSEGGGHGSLCASFVRDVCRAAIAKATTPTAGGPRE
jgi:hypothetical protein